MDWGLNCSWRSTLTDCTALILDWQSRAPLQGYIVYKKLPWIPSFRAALGPADLQWASFLWTYPGPPQIYWLLLPPGDIPGSCRSSMGPVHLELIWGLAGLLCASYTWSYSRVLLSLVASFSQLEFPHPKKVLALHSMKWGILLSSSQCGQTTGLWMNRITSIKLLRYTCKLMQIKLYIHFINRGACIVTPSVANIIPEITAGLLVIRRCHARLVCG